MDSRLGRYMLQGASRELRPSERVAFCLRSLAWNPATREHWRDVEIWHSAKLHKAHYQHLFTCGSVWQCPVCAAKISERRRVEVGDAISKWDGGLYLISLTFRHDQSSDLGLILAKLLDAYRFLHSGRAWQAFAMSCGVVGTVRALEVTYGANGWHPHLHLLLFTDVLSKLAIKKFFTARWHESLAEFGLDCDDHGVDVRDSDSMIADYIAKWGHVPKVGRGWNVEHEIAKANSKHGRAGGLSPLDILAGFALADKKRVKRRMGALWVRYCKVFKGRHQLVWSRGLRKALGLERELTDEEIAAQAIEESVLLARLSLDDWRLVLSNDARGELLNLADGGDYAVVRSFVDSLR